MKRLLLIGILAITLTSCAAENSNPAATPQPAVIYDYEKNLTIQL